jgi:ABC-type dipeptide/oligopeptide/nickel transport system permease subunit
VSATTTSPTSVDVARRRGAWAGRLRRATGGSWLVGIAIAALIAFVLAGILAPWIAPHDPNAQDLTARLLPPLSPDHVLGTDLLGRDVLSRLIHGARVSLLIGVAAVVLSGTVGVVVGVVSGYVGGLTDTVTMRVVDAWLAFPFLLLAIALIAVLGPGLRNVIIALVITGWVVYARLVRGETLSLREREYVLAARGLGDSHTNIMVRHVLPNVLAPVLVVATLELGVVIVTEASLSFLGLGVQASIPTWGGMLADGRAYLERAWWLATLPGLAIFAVVLAVNIVGDALRDAFDPRTGSSVASPAEVQERA